MSEAISEHSLRELLEGLIRVPSVNPTLVEESEGESAIAAFARDWLLERGVEAWLEEAESGRPNVVAQVGGDTGPTLILCGHIDTVSTEGMTIDPYEPRIDGDRVYGRGGYDMKGGVAAIMAAAVALRDEALAGRVMLALVVDEEHSSIGADHFVAHHEGDACIVTEPTEGKLVLAHKGFVWARLTTSGTAAHGSRWDLGESAVTKMAPLVTALDALDRDTLRGRTHPLVGPASMHASVISGGVGVSTYAPVCELKVERRTIPGETVDGVTREIEGAIRASGTEAKLDVFFSRPPLECDPGSVLAASVRDSVAAVTGESAEETGVAYWADAAIFANAGMSTVMFGPSGEGAHGALEWVSLRSVATTANVLVEAAQRFVIHDS